jgi:anti-sigma factor RsiW
MSGREPGRKTKETGHDDVRDRLSEYLDGQLLGQERQTVEEHLAACDSCRWELQTLRQTVLWTRNLPTVPVPRSFTLPVPVAQARAARPRWRLVPAFQLATAMVALLLFFAVAGDLALTGMRPASMPAPSLTQGEAAEQALETVVVEATMLAEAGVPEEAMALQAVPAEPAPEVSLEKAAEAEPPPVARTLPTEVPLEEAPVAAAAAPEVTEVPDLAATQTAAPPGMGGALPDFEPTPLPPGEEPGATAHAVPQAVSDTPPGTPGAGVEVPVTPEVAEPEAALETEAITLAEPAASLAPQPTVPPQPLATPAPPLVPGEEEAVSDPGAEVQVAESLETLAAAEPSAGDTGEPAADEVRDAHAIQGRATNWLRLIEYALATLLVLLVGTTAALMVWRRRAE